MRPAENIMQSMWPAVLCRFPTCGVIGCDPTNATNCPREKPREYSIRFSQKYENKSIRFYVGAVYALLKMN